MGQELLKFKDFIHNKKNYVWGWIGQRASDSVGLNRIFPFKFMVCCDYGKDTPIFTKGVKLFSLEKVGRIRKNWSNENLNENFENSIGNKFFRYIQGNKKSFKCICYRSTKRLEEFSSFSNGKIQILSSAEDLKTYFDNKIFVRKNMPLLGNEVIPGISTTLGETSYEETSKLYGDRVIIQFPIGSSGLNTFLIDNKRAFDLVKQDNFNQEVNITKYIDTFTVNINAVNTKINGKNKVVVSMPSVQIVGVKECCNKSTSFCGNDYVATRHLSEKVLRKVRNLTRSVGEWMSTKGYRGMFGLDILIENEKPYVLEINPRFQNSTSLLTLSQILSKRLPLSAVHVLEFMGEEKLYSKHEWDRIEREQYTHQMGAQIILHNKEDGNVKVRGEIKPGIYTLSNGGLKFKREACSALDIESNDELVVTCAVPRKNQIINPCAPILKIQTMRSALNNDLKSLNPWASRISNMLYRSLKLEAIQ